MKKGIDSEKQPEKIIISAMLQNIQTSAQEQKQELHTADDVAALVT